MGSIASSMATFRRCIKNFPLVPEGYNYHGELLLDQNRFPEAIDLFDKAIDLEKQAKPVSMNVLPLINKALAVFQWKQDFSEAEKLCQKALISTNRHRRFCHVVYDADSFLPSRPRLRYRYCHYGAAAPAAGQDHRGAQVF